MKVIIYWLEVWGYKKIFINIPKGLKQKYYPNMTELNNNTKILVFENSYIAITNVIKRFWF